MLTSRTGAEFWSIDNLTEWLPSGNPVIYLIELVSKYNPLTMYFLLKMRKFQLAMLPFRVRKWEPLWPMGTTSSKRCRGCFLPSTMPPCLHPFEKLPNQLPGVSHLPPMIWKKRSRYESSGVDSLGHFWGVESILLSCSWGAIRFIPAFDYLERFLKKKRRLSRQARQWPVIFPHPQLAHSNTSVKLKVNPHLLPQISHPPNSKV